MPTCGRGSARFVGTAHDRQGHDANLRVAGPTASEPAVTSRAAGPIAREPVFTLRAPLPPVPNRNPLMQRQGVPSFVGSRVGLGRFALGTQVHTSVDKSARAVQLSYDYEICGLRRARSLQPQAAPAIDPSWRRKTRPGGCLQCPNRGGST